MRTVVSELPSLVPYNELQGGEFIAYRSKTSTSSTINYCVLTKFKHTKKTPYPTIWGFMCLGKMDRHLVFIGLNAYESIRTAIAAGRDVKAFDTQEEMIKAMAEKSF